MMRASRRVCYFHAEMIVPNACSQIKQQSKYQKQTKKQKQMKAPKILVAGLLAFSIAGVANAQTIIHITGSTAFRAGVHQAIKDVLQPGTTTIGYVGSSLSGASEAIFNGTTINGGAIPVTIKTYWSGSVGGIQTVSGQLPLANAWLTNGSPASSGSGTAIGSPGFESPGSVPDVCMSDVFQSSSPFTSPALYPLPNGFIVGVVPFKWIRNNGSPASWTNMSAQEAVSLYTYSGSLPLSLFTGKNSDEGTNVYALGRNEDSGTRLTAFAETGVGVFNYVQQYYPTNSAGVRVAKGVTPLNVASQGFVPPTTVNGVSYPADDSGYSSGGDLAAALSATGSSTAAGINGFYAGYVGLSDAATAEAGGASDLSYNGVPYSTNAVQEGQYTFWGYEHMYWRSGFSGNPYTVANLIANELLTNDSAVISGGVAPGILLQNMNVSRDGDGAPVINGNSY